MRQTYIKPEIEKIPLLTTGAILEVSGPESGGTGETGDYGQAKVGDEEFGW